MMVRVRVKKSKKNEVIEGKVLTVFLEENAEKGKANKSLLKILKKHFNSDVRIKSGFFSEEKILEVG